MWWAGIFKFSCLRLQLLFIYRMAQYKPLEISDGVEYPQYAQTIGWILTCFVMCPIPIYFIYKVVTAEGSLMEVRKKTCLLNFFLINLMVNFSKCVTLTAIFLIPQPILF